MLAVSCVLLQSPDGDPATGHMAGEGSLLSRSTDQGAGKVATAADVFVLAHLTSSVGLTDAHTIPRLELGGGEGVQPAAASLQSHSLQGDSVRGDSVPHCLGLPGSDNSS